MLIYIFICHLIVIMTLVCELWICIIIYVRILFISHAFSKPSPWSHVFYFLFGYMAFFSMITSLLKRVVWAPDLFWWEWVCDGQVEAVPHRRGARVLWGGRPMLSVSGCCQQKTLGGGKHYWRKNATAWGLFLSVSTLLWNILALKYFLY